MGQCLTRPTLFAYSGCLVEKPECGYKSAVGFSYLCTHPDHKKFHGHVNGHYSEEELLNRYLRLKEARREEFLASLDDSGRTYFLKE